MAQNRLEFKTCISKTKTKTLRFKDVETPRFKTKTETKTCKNGSRDVSRPRLKS